MWNRDMFDRGPVNAKLKHAMLRLLACDYVLPIFYYYLNFLNIHFASAGLFCTRFSFAESASNDACR